MTKYPAKDRFFRMVDDISRLYADARQAQVRFAWETGRRIVEEEQDGALRAVYGSNLISALSESLTRKCGQGFSVTTLKKMRKFYLSREKGPTSDQLDWSGYLELLPIKSDRARRQIERRARKESLSVREIRLLAREHLRLESQSTAATKQNGQDIGEPTLLKRPSNLKFSTFLLDSPQRRDTDGRILIDCGFSVYCPVSAEEIKAVHRTASPSYTYRARVDRVVDGDTLLVMIALGFGIQLRERLRLRGVDCPELSTKEGARAKLAVEALLPPNSMVAIKTRKSGKDIYGRYLADVFYGEDFDSLDAVPASAGYLNQYLLDNTLAQMLEM